MKNIKDELQNIILGDEQTGSESRLKEVQNFLRGYAQSSILTKDHQLFKGQETTALITFAKAENCFYNYLISVDNFISEGAEQKVYRLDDTQVLKINQSVFYESWLDYFNSLLIHNFFFPATAYSFLGFKIIDNELYAVIKQNFIIADKHIALELVKEFLEYNGFQHKRNNDYFNPEIGIILEDLHDENVLTYNGVLYFIDTVFYLTEAFYSL